MDLIELIKTKREKADMLIKKYKFNKKNKILWYIHFDEYNDFNDLFDWLSKLWVNFIVSWVWENTSNIIYTQDKLEFIWFDFVICDKCSQKVEYNKNWVTQIWYSLYSNIKDFDPRTSVWNWFLYNELSKWDIFQAVIRYLENYKFSYDNKALIKNIIEFK